MRDPVHALYAFIFWIVFLLLVVAPFVYWQQGKGKTMEEIVVGKPDPVREKRVTAMARIALISGLVLIGLFVAWVRWRFP